MTLRLTTVVADTFSGADAELRRDAELCLPVPCGVEDSKAWEQETAQALVRRDARVLAARYMDESGSSIPWERVSPVLERPRPIMWAEVQRQTIRRIQRLATRFTCLVQPINLTHADVGQDYELEGFRWTSSGRPDSMVLVEVTQEGLHRLRRPEDLARDVAWRELWTTLSPWLLVERSLAPHVAELLVGRGSPDEILARSAFAFRPYFHDEGLLVVSTRATVDEIASTFDLGSPD